MLTINQPANKSLLQKRLILSRADLGGVLGALKHARKLLEAVVAFGAVAFYTHVWAMKRWKEKGE